MNAEERGRYYASREWALLKAEVRKRSDGICERCFLNPYTQTHHLTYLRFGKELLEDLQGLCNGCHEFVSGKSSLDPKLIAQQVNELRWHDAFVSALKEAVRLKSPVVFSLINRAELRVSQKKNGKGNQIWVLFSEQERLSASLLSETQNKNFLCSIADSMTDSQNDIVIGD